MVLKPVQLGAAVVVEREFYSQRGRRLFKLTL